MKHHTLARSLGTHNGTFHADEVTACALLLLFDLIDQDRIIRTRDLQLLEECEYVCDVGGIYDPSRKLFDHHQLDYQGKMSSAGMILLYLKEQEIITPTDYELFNSSLVAGVDAHDNGVDIQQFGVCTYSHLISNFNPVPYTVEESEHDHAFFEAVSFSKNHLQRLWERFRYTQSCRKMVLDAMQKGGDCLVFDQGIPWIESFFELNGINHPARFVIMPSGKHWKLRGVPPTFERRMEVRLPLPKEWAGLLEEELKRVSGISGAIFCHKGRFISVWETKEDALKALDYILKEGHAHVNHL